MFLGFGLDAWITIVTVLGMFTILLFTKWRSDLVFLGAIGVLYVTGVLDAKEAFSGFSSTSVITVGVLFVVVAGLTYTGVLQYIVKYLLGSPNSYSKALSGTLRSGNSRRMAIIDSTPIARQNSPGMVVVRMFMATPVFSS